MKDKCVSKECEGLKMEGTRKKDGGEEGKKEKIGEKERKQRKKIKQKIHLLSQELNTMFSKHNFFTK